MTRLTARELRRISNSNKIIFNVIALANMGVFYHSLHTENWMLLFVSFGFFITALAVYDNYKVSKKHLERAEKRY